MKKTLLTILMFSSLWAISQDFQWVKDLSDSDPENYTITDIEIGPNGYIYVLGNFENSIDLAPGSTEYILTSQGDKDFFIARYTPSGQFYSAFTSGNDGSLSNSNSDELAYDMVITSGGTIYVTGSFENRYYFAPYEQGSEINSTCTKNMFVAEFNENIQYQDVFLPYDCYEDMDVTAIEGKKLFYHSPNDVIYVAGRFTGSIDLSSSQSIYTNDSQYDLFFAQMESNGTFNWGKALKSSVDDTETVAGIFVHPDYEYIYIAGTFGDNGTFDLNPHTSATANVTCSGWDDIFLAMYSPSGSYYSSSYANKIGSSSSDFVYDFEMDSDGNIYLAGNNTQYRTVDIDIKSSTQNISAGQGNDGYVVKYNYLLSYQWHVVLESTQNNVINGIGIDENDDLCVQGWFYGDCNFNSNGTAYNMSAGSYIDMFYGKYTGTGQKQVIHQIGDETSNTSGNMVLGANKYSSSMILFGKYQNTLDFDGGPNEHFSTPVDYYNGRYFAKYDHCSATNIVSHPNDDQTCEGNEVALNVSVAGTNLTYQWYKNTTALSNGYSIYGNVLGATSNSMVIDATNSNTSGVYKCEVISSCDAAVFTNTGTVTIDLEPEITSDPTDVVICEGNNTSFSVTAQDANTYQWLVNTGSGSYQALSDDAQYSGTQSSTLNITGVQANQSYYQYKCLVTGDCTPNAFSNPASLVVNPNPNIQTHPANTAVCEGSSATLSISTNGGGLNYQWQRSNDGGTTFINIANNSFYSGVSTSALTISNVNTGFDNYEYKCVVSGTCGSDMTSNAAILTVNELAQLTSQPVDITECENEDVVLNVNATGYNVNYRWQVNEGSSWENLNNGGSYSNVTGASLDISYIDPSLSGNQYRCLITSGCSANLYSNAVDLTVSQAPNITVSSSEGTDICDGTTTELSITGGDPSYTYQWNRNYSALAGENTDALIVSQSGVYSLYAENTTGCSSETVPVTVNVHAVPNATITVIGNSEFCEGSYAELIVPSGNGYTYQWLDASSPISGSISNSLIVTESGSYAAQITSTYGCENTSATEVITVNPLPMVTLSNTDIELCQGETELLTASYDSDYIYQWKQNNLTMSGENSNELEVTTAGLFSVDVINATTGCTYTSAYATAIINALPTPNIIASGNLVVCVDDAIELSLDESYSQYTWSDFSTGSTLNVDQNGTYAVTVSDANGCENFAEIVITEQLVQTPNICMVTVDTALNKNLIVWEHLANNPGVASYNVYKLESSSYQLLGNVLYNDTTEFVDPTSQPDIHSDKYAIAAVDSCGNIGAYSPFHQTMNLSIVDGSGDGITLIWTKYIDETGVNDPTEYEIYRGMSDLQYYASITGGLSDYNYNIPTVQTGERFIIVVQRPIGCAPLNDSRATGGPYYQSVSNVEDEGIISTGTKHLSDVDLEIYPNPAKDVVNITYGREINTLKVYNILGQTEIEETNLSEQNYRLNVSQLENGTYFIEINNLQKQKLIIK